MIDQCRPKILEGDLDHRRAAVHIVVRKLGGKQPINHFTHLGLRQWLAGLDRRLTREKPCDTLVLVHVSTTGTRVGQVIEQIGQSRLGIECMPESRHRRDRYRITTKRFDLESQPFDQTAIRLPGRKLLGSQVQHRREQQSLTGTRLLANITDDLLVENAFVG
jgi:hypothetical protein